LSNPVRVDVAPEVTTAEKIEQSVFFVAKAEKRSLLQKLIRSEGAKRSIVFTRTKHGANRLAEQLSRAGIEAEAIHGNKSQGARERALEGFKNGGIPVLVATDIAARGIDVDGITHVFNFDLPNVPESYVHRIGRTARAGAAGRAIAFCDVDERVLLRDIERFIKQPIPVATASLDGAPLSAVGVVAPAVAAKPNNSVVMPGDSTRARRSRRHRGARLY
jgi:ATP-dependent RNA helicase RhlE